MPDNLALIVPYQGVRWTFADLDREVDRVTRGLLACGLEPGDRIGIWAPNRSEWLLTMFAAARAGLILVNINPAYRITELEFALQLVGCRALVFAPQFKSSDYAAMLDSLIPELRTAAPGQLLCAAFPELRLLVQLGALARAAGLPLIRRSSSRRAWLRGGLAGGARGRARCGPNLQRPIHERDHGHAEGCGAHAFQHRQQWLLCRRSPAAWRR